MDQTFKALLVSRDEAKKQSVNIVDMNIDDLMDGDTVVRITHSTVNYKDGLAVTGKGPVIRKFPLIPGIDLAGEVVSSEHADFKPGDQVLLNGWGVGEAHHGAYAGMARVKGDWLIHKPEGFSAADTMAIGTAGYTAMLCVMALEDHGVSPDRGKVIVTGAAGGVGSTSIAILAKLGYEVIASTGRTSEADYLKGLGAAEIIDRNELSQPPERPLMARRWAGGIDAVGSNTLANLLAMTDDRGTIAACGLVGGMDLPTTVAPFILRGVTLAGIESVMAPKDLRIRAWQRLERDLDVGKLHDMVTTIGFEDIQATAEQIVAGQVRGRVVVEIG
jgi:acrylyl-CoA reductase (NADPH)